MPDTPDILQAKQNKTNYSQVDYFDTSYQHFKLISTGDLERRQEFHVGNIFRVK